MPNQIAFYPQSGGGLTLIGSVQTLASAASTISFTSIPQNYNNLLVIFAGANNTGGTANVTLNFNADTGANYNVAFLQNSGATAIGGTQTAQTAALVGVISNGGSSVIRLDIPAYAKTTLTKTFACANPAINAAIAQLVTPLAAGWNSTAAITSITLNCSQFSAGSVAMLYGY